MASKIESPSRDEVLKRMLKMKPKPHKSKPGKAPKPKAAKRKSTD